MSCALGFDVGSRRIGVAIGSPLTGGARPLAVLPVHDGAPDWDTLDRLTREWQPNTLVIGLPLTLEGDDQPASRQARRFASALDARYGLPTLLVDERHSSQEAAARFAAARASGQRRRRDGERIDADAAAVILERWLTQIPAPAAHP